MLSLQTSARLNLEQPFLPFFLELSPLSPQCCRLPRLRMLFEHQMRNYSESLTRTNQRVLLAAMMNAWWAPQSHSAAAGCQDVPKTMSQDCRSPP